MRRTIGASGADGQVPGSGVAIVRLVGAVLAEQTDEWVKGRRYLGLDVVARCCLNLVPDTSTEEVTTSALPSPTA